VRRTNWHESDEKKEKGKDKGDDHFQVRVNLLRVIAVTFFSEKGLSRDGREVAIVSERAGEA